MGRVSVCVFVCMRRSKTDEHLEGACRYLQSSVSDQSVHAVVLSLLAGEDRKARARHATRGQKGARPGVVGLPPTHLFFALPPLPPLPLGPARHPITASGFRSPPAAPDGH